MRATVDQGDNRILLVLVKTWRQRDVAVDPPSQGTLEPEVPGRLSVEYRRTLDIERREALMSAIACIDANDFGRLNGVFPASEEYPTLRLRTGIDTATFGVQRIDATAAISGHAEQPHPALVGCREIHTTTITANGHVRYGMVKPVSKELRFGRKIPRLAIPGPVELRNLGEVVDVTGSRVEQAIERIPVPGEFCRMTTPLIAARQHFWLAAAHRETIRRQGDFRAPV